MNQVSVILLAGGNGTRMQMSTPKQFLLLKNKPLILYSFDFFKQFPSIHEIIVVVDPSYQYLFKPTEKISLKFALPGKRRQDSVYNGFLQVSKNQDFVLIHDGARPFLEKVFLDEVLENAFLFGAATVAKPVKFTVKEEENGFIKKTLDRNHLYEIQTPQVIRYDLLKKGFEFAKLNDLDVTDDVSLIEKIEHPVKLVNGSYDNIKITTQEDLTIAEHILEKRNEFDDIHL